MFNLIVKASEWTGGQAVFPGSRIFEYTDNDLEERYRPAGRLEIAELRDLPTIFVEESFPPKQQVARVGFITEAHMVGGDLSLSYGFDSSIPPVPNSEFRAFASELGIQDFEFSRTHWAVKRADLFRSLLRHLQPRRNRPTVFYLKDPVAIEKTLMSAMMPFDPAFDAVYEALKRAGESAGHQCRRADDIWENPSVIQDIVSLIDRSRVVVCDCTNRNPNVFYEIGIAHTLGREVILITQSEHDIPFDLRHLRYLTYLNNGEGLDALAGRIANRLESLA